MKGGQVLSEHPLPPGAELIVGRSEGCDVTIADGSVSRLHARLVGDGEGVYVEDLGSANGTFVDGTRARGRVRLADGQEVRVGQRAQAAPFVLRIQDDRQAKVDEATETRALRERWARFAADGGDGDADSELLPPLPPTPAPNEPLWRMGTPDAAPLMTVAVTDADRPPPARAASEAAPPRAANMPTPPRAARPATPRTTDAPPPPTTAAASPPLTAGAPRRKNWIWALAALALFGLVGVAALAAWWLVGSRRPHVEAPTTSSNAEAAVPKLAPRPPPVPTQAAVAAAPAAPAPSPAPEVLVVPPATETTTVTAVGAASPPAANPAHPLAGKWAARLENVFYPEDDYVIELRLDLQQRGGEVGGGGRITIEGKAMTFGVPATTVSGTIRRGPPPWAVSLRLPFGRPIGELQLEGTLDGDALAGTFRSSAAKQPGAWQAVRSKE